MGRLVGYMANRTDRLRAALYQEREVVATRPASGPAGFGIGFYQGGEVLHKKRPSLSEADVDFQELAKDVQSDCVVMHLRQPTVGDFRSHNTHPFRFRRWMFAHTGTVDRFDALEDRLRETLPDFLRRNVRGRTDSEQVFHVILSFLHDVGQLDAIDVDTNAVLGALRAGVALVDRLVAEVGGNDSALNMLLTNGRHMFAVRRGSPMMFVERRGLHDPPDHLTPSKPNAPTTLRYVMVVSDGPNTPPDWTGLEDRSVAVIDRNLEVSVHKL